MQTFSFLISEHFFHMTRPKVDIFKGKNKLAKLFSNLYIYPITLCKRTVSGIRGRFRGGTPFGGEFYFQKVLYLMSKHTKRYLKGKNTQKIRIRRVNYTAPTQYHSYIKGKEIPAPPLLKISVSDAGHQLR